MSPESDLKHEDAEVAPAEGDEAPALDPEREARRVAAMSFIRKLGDPVLKSSATPVDRFDDSLRRQVSRMAGIMEDAIGIGLAAPQLGISTSSARCTCVFAPRTSMASGASLRPRVSRRG
jgi:hypothetical protein